MIYCNSILKETAHLLKCDGEPYCSILIDNDKKEYLGWMTSICYKYWLIVPLNKHIKRKLFKGHIYIRDIFAYNKNTKQIIISFRRNNDLLIEEINSIYSYQEFNSYLPEPFKNLQLYQQNYKSISLLKRIKHFINESMLIIGLYKNAYYI